MKKITELTAELAAPAIAEQGCTLWDVEYVKEAGTWYLRILLDKEGGVDILDCEEISRKVIKLSIIFHIFRNISDCDIISLIIIVDVGFHFHQINDSLEIIFFTDWQLKNDCIFTKSCSDLIYSIVEISTKNIHLVDECHSWNVVCVSLTPYVL